MRLERLSTGMALFSHPHRGTTRRYQRRLVQAEDRAGVDLACAGAAVNFTGPRAGGVYLRDRYHGQIPAQLCIDVQASCTSSWSGSTGPSFDAMLLVLRARSSRTMT